MGKILIDDVTVNKTIEALARVMHAPATVNFSNLQKVYDDLVEASRAERNKVTTSDKYVITVTKNGSDIMGYVIET